MAVSDVVITTVYSLQDALLNVWYSFLNVVPGLVGALIVVLLGYIVALLLERVAVHVLQMGMVDKWVEERNLDGAIGKIKLSVIFGALLKWYIFVLFLAQSLYLVNLSILSMFVAILVNYIPIASASIILVVLGLLVARYIANKISLTDHKYKKSVAVIVEVVIAYMAVVMGLENLGFRVTVLLDAFRIGFTVFVIIAAIALGLYFSFAYRREIQELAKSFKK